jgi:hypothetical protein
MIRPEFQASETPVLVAGDGWGALAAVGFLSGAGVPVRWIAGNSARIVSPLPTWECGPGARAWELLARAVGVAGGESQTGSFLREFRNKSFREPAWYKAPTPGDRRSVREEVLWAPEIQLAPLFESRPALTAGELEEAIRARLVPENFPGLERIEGAPIASLEVEPDGLRAAILASGRRLETRQLVYADRWSRAGAMQGLPLRLNLVAKRDPMGLLQATLTHAVPVGAGLREGFFAVMNREAGDEHDRHLWGYFTEDGKRSLWTVCLAPEEVEDNHAIAKRLRRMKSTLEKMFSGSSWLPPAAEGTEPSFLANVASEQVRFEDFFIFSAGEPPREATRFPGAQGVWFVTDGYGPSAALAQLGFLLQEDLGTADLGTAESAEASPGLQASPERPDAQGEKVDLAGSKLE